MDRVPSPDPQPGPCWGLALRPTYPTQPILPPSPPPFPNTLPTTTQACVGTIHTHAYRKREREREKGGGEDGDSERLGKANSVCNSGAAQGQEGEAKSTCKERKTYYTHILQTKVYSIFSGGKNVTIPLSKLSILSL